MPVKRTCVGCGRAFLVPPSMAKRQWCSAACRYATPGWEDGLGTKRRKVCTCEVCGVTFEATQSKVGRFCSRRCLGVANGKRQSPNPAKWHMYQCLQCGRPYRELVWKAFRTHFCSRACNGTWYARKRRIARPTSIEVALEAALRTLGLEPEREFRVGAYSIDLALPRRLIAIEADGDYWHSFARQKLSDARKDAYLVARGWAVLRFSEGEITADAAACASVVAALLEQK